MAVRFAIVGDNVCNGVPGAFTINSTTGIVRLNATVPFLPVPTACSLTLELRDDNKHNKPPFQPGVSLFPVDVKV